MQAKRHMTNLIKFRSYKFPLWKTLEDNEFSLRYRTKILNCFKETDVGK